MRLLAVVAGTVFLLVLIGTLTGGEDRAAADRSYLEHLAGPATDSQAVGTELTALLRDRALTANHLEGRLRTLGQRQAHDTARLAEITPPPRLRSQHAQALQAFRFRDSGLAALLSGVVAATAARGSAGAGVLAAAAERLLTSDVVWRDFFVARTEAQLRVDGAARSPVPRSVFLADPNLGTPEAMANVLALLRAGGGAASAAVLRPGATGTSVVLWQRQLNEWLAHQPGRRQLPLTGIYDQATGAATVRLQRAAGIATDGVVGPATRSALTHALHR